MTSRSSSRDGPTGPARSGDARHRGRPGDPTTPGGWDSAVDGCDAVVNLAGHNVFAERWNAEVKRKIRDSRVYRHRERGGGHRQGRSRPRVLVQASAIGYYGPRGDEELTESSPSGSDFMAVVCREWEEAAVPPRRWACAWPGSAPGSSWPGTRGPWA